MQIGTHAARRSPRILLQVPLLIRAPDGAVRGHTVVVNRHGALVLSPLRAAEDTLIKLQNLVSGASALCRVVFCGGEELPGLFKLGLELMGSEAGFWGSEFESRLGELVNPPAA